MQPGADIGGIGMGLVRMVRPWNEWLIVWGYDINEPPPEVDEAVATRVVHNLVGDDTIEVKLRSTSLWGNNKMYAKRYVEGRVFCMGDALPPAPAEQRPGIEHVDRGRLQPRLEARARAAGQGGAVAAGLL